MRVPKRREEVSVERVSVNREATEAEIGKDEEFFVPVSEEEVVVEKRPVVKEEIRLRKDVVEEEEVVERDVRKEERTARFLDGVGGQPVIVVGDLSTEGDHTRGGMRANT